MRKCWIRLICFCILLFGSNSTAMAADEVKNIPVIMYHHFGEEASSTIVEPEVFHQQMRYLKEEGYTTITMRELVEYRAGKKPLPEKPVVITVDDGYESNYTYMLPILQEYGHKATVFLVTGQMRTEETNQFDPYSKLSWRQIQEMHKTGLVDFQSHTNDAHYKIERNGIQRGALAIYKPGEHKVSYEQRVKQDLQQSRVMIKQYLGYYPIVFSYPYGEFSDELDRYAKQLGFKSTVTVIEGMNQSNSDLYRLKRTNICGFDDIDMFAKKIEGKANSKTTKCLCLEYNKSAMKVQYKGIDLNLTKDMYNTKINTTALISVQDFAQAMGIEFSWDRSISCATLVRNDFVATIYPDKDVTVNRAEVVDPIKPRVIEGELYAPIRVLAKGLGFNMSYYSQPERVVLWDSK